MVSGNLDDNALRLSNKSKVGKKVIVASGSVCGFKLAAIGTDCGLTLAD